MSAREVRTQSPSDEMHMLPGLVGALLALAPACPLYVYDDGPEFGYVAAAVDAELSARKMPAHKKYYISNPVKNKKLVNERAVDSYFRLLRAPPQALRQRGPARAGRPPRTQRPRAPRSGAPDEVLLEQARREYFGKHRVYDKQQLGADGNAPAIEANFQKPTQWRSEPRTAAPSRRQAARAPPGPHKANGDGDRNVQATARVFTDRNLDTVKEYRKRDALVNGTGRREMEKLNNKIHKSAANNIDTYDRDTFRKFDRAKPPARVGKYDVGSEARNPPYALFYRANPDLDGAEAPDEAEAYYRGGATNYVDINTGRKAAKTIGALDTTNQFISL